MAFSFFTKIIGAKGKRALQFKSQAFLNTMEQQMETFANTEVLPMYQAGVRNWLDEHKPIFVIHRYVMMNVFSLAVGTDSGDSRIYRFVDEGTSIRWALMSSDWVSKTDPSRYWSEAGDGMVLIRGEAMIRAGIAPRPGLEPRDFSGQIVKEITPWWNKWMRDALRLARIDMEMESWK